MDRLLCQIDEALSPAPGRRAVALLYLRALALSTSAFPWMAAAARGNDQALDFARLGAVFEQQAAEAALAGGFASPQSLYDLLRDLVGQALTEQWRRRVWIASPGAKPVQDT